jgi:hypothetical protein
VRSKQGKGPSMETRSAMLLVATSALLKAGFVPCAGPASAAGTSAPRGASPASQHWFSFSPDPPMPQSDRPGAPKAREQLVMACRGTGSPAGSWAVLAGLRPDRLFLVTGQRGSPERRPAGVMSIRALLNRREGIDDLRPGGTASTLVPVPRRRGPPQGIGLAARSEPSPALTRRGGWVA